MWLMCKHAILQSVVSGKRKSWSHKLKFQKIEERGKGKEQTEKPEWQYQNRESLQKKNVDN